MTISHTVGQQQNHHQSTIAGCQSALHSETIHYTALLFRQTTTRSYYTVQCCVSEFQNMARALAQIEYDPS